MVPIPFGEMHLSFGDFYSVELRITPQWGPGGQVAVKRVATYHDDRIRLEVVDKGNLRVVWEEACSIQGNLILCKIKGNHTLTSYNKQLMQFIFDVFLSLSFISSIFVRSAENTITWPMRAV